MRRHLTRARGYPIEGASLSDRGVVLADSLEHPHSIAHGLLVASLTCACARNLAGLQRYVPRLLAVAEKFNFLPYAAVGTFLSQLYGGPPTDLEKLEADFLRACPLTPLPIPLTVLMAERLIDAGRGNDVLDITNATLAELKNPAIGFYLSELHRVRAEALFLLRREDGAKAEGDKALGIARSQNARLLELRTQCTRARLGIPEAEGELRESIAKWADNETCADIANARLVVERRGAP